MAAPVRWQPSVPTAQGEEHDKTSTNPIEVFEKRSAEWNMHSRPVLDRATWLLVHAAAARFAGLDPTTSDLAAVGQALRECPEVVTDALRLLDQADVRRASALMAAAAPPRLLLEP